MNILSLVNFNSSKNVFAGKVHNTTCNNLNLSSINKAGF